jgi:hypothetical protein
MIQLRMLDGPRLRHPGAERKHRRLLCQYACHSRRSTIFVYDWQLSETSYVIHIHVSVFDRGDGTR